MDTIFGNIDLTVNITAGSITLGRRNDSIPLFLWRDPNPGHPSNNVNAFHDLRYATVEVVENAMSSSHHYYGAGKFCAWDNNFEKCDLRTK